MEEKEIRNEDGLLTEFNYFLIKKIQYAFKGDMTEASFITFYAPTSKVTKECAALKQAFFRAIGEQEGEGEADPDYEIQGDDILNLLAMSKEVDLPDVMEIAKKLFQAPGIALVDGETKLGNSLFDKLSIDDCEAMLGKYLANFTLASALKSLKEKSLKESSN